MQPFSKQHQNSLWWIAGSVAILAVAVVAVGTTGNPIRDTLSIVLPEHGTLRLMPVATSVKSPLSLVTRQPDQASVQSSIISVRLVESSTSNTRSGSVGTGFIWDAAGHVVVPARLLGAITRVSASLPDGSATRGQTVGTDVATNIAVVRLDRVSDESSPIAEERAAIRAGEQVSIVWNNPSGETVIEPGTVAATGRLLPIGTMTSPLGEGYIAIPDVVRITPAHAQATPAMPGNALVVDAEGTLVGMLLPYMDRNSAAYYAMPREMIDQIVGSLVATGQYQHPWLGISIRTVTEERARALNLPVNEGVQVMAVLPESPAERAGLRGSTTLVRMGDDITYTGGDIITAVEGNQIQTVDDLLRYLVRRSAVGQNIAIDVNRNGQNLTIHVQVGARPNTAVLD